MAYRQPGITVTQIFVNAAPALAAFSLPNVIVGPVFQVLSQEVEGTYAASLQTYTYSGQMLGTYVDLRPLDPTDLVSYPVSIFIQNAIARILAAVSTGAVAGGNLNQFTDSTTNVFQNVAAGDVIVITGSLNGNNGTYTVRQVVNNNTLQVNETFTAAETSLNYSVRRNIGTVSVPSTYSGVVIAQAGVTLPASISTTYAPFGSIPILSGSVALSYRALRVDYSSDLTEFANTLTLQAAFPASQIVPENVAVFGVFVALNNAVTPSNLLGLDMNYLNTGFGSGNEILAYDDAFAILSNNDIYAIATMTQNPSIPGILKTHVDGYSAPGGNLERVGIVNRQLITVQTVVPTSTTGAVDSTGLIFTDADALFITDGVAPGNFINISAGATAGRYAIGAVNSQTSVTLVNLSPAPISGGPLTGITYTVDENLSLDGQAAVLAAYAASIGDRRMVITWPDVVAMPVGNLTRNLPGYFLSCSVAALTTGLPTQQGLTNLDVALYTGVVHSTKYFNQTQLNVIAGGGVMIFVQDVLNVSALYIRHQLTSDLSSVFFQEYSVTKNVDFIAKFLRQQHKPFIGQYNIVDGTFSDLKTTAKGDLNFLSENPLPKIGSVLKSGTLVSVIQNPNEIDGVLESYNLSIPIPLNDLDITLYVSN